MMINRQIVHATKPQIQNDRYRTRE